MTQNVSRRAIVGGLGVAAGSLVTNPAIATMPEPGTTLTVK